MSTRYNKMVNEEDDERTDSDSESVNQSMKETTFIPVQKGSELEEKIFKGMDTILKCICTWFRLIRKIDYETANGDSDSDTEENTIRAQRKRQIERKIIWGMIVVLSFICAWFLLKVEEDYETTDSDSDSDTESIEETITVHDQNKRKHSDTSAGQSQNSSIHAQKKIKESATSAVQPQESSNHAQKARKQSADSAVQSQNSTNQDRKKGKQSATSSMESEDSEGETDDEMTPVMLKMSCTLLDYMNNYLNNRQRRG